MTRSFHGRRAKNPLRPLKAEQRVKISTSAGLTMRAYFGAIGRVAKVERDAFGTVWYVVTLDKFPGTGPFKLLRQEVMPI